MAILRMGLSHFAMQFGIRVVGVHYRNGWEVCRALLIGLVESSSLLHL